VIWSSRRLNLNNRPACDRFRLGEVVPGRRWISSHRCVLIDSGGSPSHHGPVDVWSLSEQHRHRRRSFSFTVKATPFTLVHFKLTYVASQLESFHPCVCVWESMIFSDSERFAKQRILLQRVCRMSCIKLSFEDTFSLCSTRVTFCWLLSRYFLPFLWRFLLNFGKETILKSLA